MTKIVGRLFSRETAAVCNPEMTYTTLTSIRIREIIQRIRMKLIAWSKGEKIRKLYDFFAKYVV